MFLSRFLLIIIYIYIRVFFSLLRVDGCKDMKLFFYLHLSRTRIVVNFSFGVLHKCKMSFIFPL